MERKMFRALIYISISLFTIVAETNAQDSIPKVKGSYKASGETVETLDDDTEFQIQVAFEESFDSDTQDAVFRLWVQGKSVTYVENYQAGQTFKYLEDLVCQEMTVKEWVTTKTPPQLLNYEDTNGTVRFSLKQLFSLDDQYLKKKKAMPTTFRGVAAKMWEYEMFGTDPVTNELRVINVNAYWSDVSWNTTSNEESVPLGYIVSKFDYKRNSTGAQLHKQFINVYGFVQGAVDHKLFEPVQGVICPNKKQTIKFPDVSNIKALSIHSEVLFPDFLQIKYVDTWFDPQNKLLRVDMERIKDQVPSYEKENRKYQSEMVLGKLGVVYRLAYSKGSLTCSVIPIKEFDLDIQSLINFKADDWKIGKMFGLNQTSYVYIGKTSKRDIPCHLFQGKRLDWPEPSANVESLWEWCFSTNDSTKENSVIFKNGEYGLISAQVKILNTTSIGDYPPNFRIIHHFYDVNSEDPNLMDATKFDIAKCFQEEEKRRLQFTVTYHGLIVEESLEDLKNLTSDIRFLLAFKNAIYQRSGLDPKSLRISDVKAIVEDKNLFLKFTILAPHKDLPEDIKKKEISTAEAENKLKQAIDNNMFFINYIVRPGKEVQFHANSQSLLPQLNNTFIPHTLQPTSLSTSTPGHTFTTPSVTTPTTNRPIILPKRELHESKKTLHKAGTITGVSVAMLVVGVSTGAALIFLMMKGLPSCLKRRKGVRPL